MIEIIAEIGQNHCGDMNLAKYLIAEAKINGADSVKFQLYDSLALYGRKQDAEPTKEQAFDLFEYGEDCGIPIFFSAFDKERIDWCREMGVSRIKIASGRARETEFIEYAGMNDMPLLISIYGMPYKLPNHMRNYNWLFCVPNYPAKLTDLHLHQVTFKLAGNGIEKYGRDVIPEYTGWFDGFSDHTIGLDAAKIALSRGAKIIEKHFAVDHKTGIDAEWSMTPTELNELVRFKELVQEVL